MVEVVKRFLLGNRALGLPLKEELLVVLGFEVVVVVLLLLRFNGFDLEFVEPVLPPIGGLDNGVLNNFNNGFCLLLDSVVEVACKVVSFSLFSVSSLICVVTVLSVSFSDDSVLPV